LALYPLNGLFLVNGVSVRGINHKEINLQGSELLYAFFVLRMGGNRRADEEALAAIQRGMWICPNLF
jgi:hypothetical protein